MWYRPQGQGFGTRTYANVQAFGVVYHVELRKFPNTACAFNLGEEELREIVEPWAQDRWVEVGERKWSPYEAKLIVLEGPRLPVEDLAMGRGWSSAQRHGEDVTERVLAQAREPRPSADVATGAAATTGAKTPGASATPAPPGDGGAVGQAPAGAASTPPSGAEFRFLLGPDPVALLAAWRLAAERRPELSPSQSLALAEQTLSAMDGSG